MDKTNYITFRTAQWLLNKCYSKDGKLLKDSYKDELSRMTTVDDLKAFIWTKCKPHVSNIAAFKKG